MVAPSSIAISKSLLMPMLSSGERPSGHVLHVVAEVPEPGERGARVLGILGERSDGHQSHEVDRRDVDELLHHGLDVRFCDAEAGWQPGQLDLEQHADRDRVPRVDVSTAHPRRAGCRPSGRSRTAPPRVPALLVCRWPIRCQRAALRTSRCLSAASWIRFSPTSSTPAAIASSTRAAGIPLRDGDQPHVARVAIRARAAAVDPGTNRSSRSATGASAPPQPPHLPRSRGSSRPSVSRRLRCRRAVSGRVPGGCASTSSMVARISCASLKDRYTEANRM